MDESGADIRLAASAVENFSPYALYADDGPGDLNIGAGLEDGDYRLDLTFYSEDRRGGEVIGAAETCFAVDDASVADLATIAIVDTEADTLLGELTPVGDGFLFNAGSANPADLGLLADVPDPRVDSVRLTLRDADGLVHRQLENNPPYALFSDDSAGDFEDGAPDLDAGAYQLTLELFAGPNATDLVASDTIAFDLLFEVA